MPPAPRPLSDCTIAAWALVGLAVVAMVRFVLQSHYGGQKAPVQLDAIRTAGTLVIGTGGAMALLLTPRRQRYIELTLVHTDRDAPERRIAVGATWSEGRAEVLVGAQFNGAAEHGLALHQRELEETGGTASVKLDQEVDADEIAEVRLHRTAWATLGYVD